jgi:hypothetical protein
MRVDHRAGQRGLVAFVGRGRRADQRGGQCQALADAPTRSSWVAASVKVTARLAMRRPCSTTRRVNSVARVKVLPVPALASISRVPRSLRQIRLGGGVEGAHAASASRPARGGAGAQQVVDAQADSLHARIGRIVGERIAAAQGNRIAPSPSAKPPLPSPCHRLYAAARRLSAFSALQISQPVYANGSGACRPSARMASSWRKAARACSGGSAAVTNGPGPASGVSWICTNGKPAPAALASGQAPAQRGVAVERGRPHPQQAARVPSATRPRTQAIDVGLEHVRRQRRAIDPGCAGVGKGRTCASRASNWRVPSAPDGSSARAQAVAQARLAPSRKASSRCWRMRLPARRGQHQRFDILVPRQRLGQAQAQALGEELARRVGEAAQRLQRQHVVGLRIGLGGRRQHRPAMATTPGARRRRGRRPDATGGDN